MAVRLQPRHTSGHSLPLGRHRALVHQTGGPERPVTIQYVRYTPEGPTPTLWRPAPENAVLVDVPGAESAPTLEEGKLLARRTMARLESGEVRGEKRPFDPVARAEIVTELQHSTKMLRAIVLRWPDVYEVSMIGYVPDGYTLPVATPSISTELGWGWGLLDLFERLLADTEKEAMDAARAELERLAGMDLPVRDRATSKESQSVTSNVAMDLDLREPGG